MIMKKVNDKYVINMSPITWKVYIWKINKAKTEWLEKQELDDNFAVNLAIEILRNKHKPWYILEFKDWEWRIEISFLTKEDLEKRKKDKK